MQKKQKCKERKNARNYKKMKMNMEQLRKIKQREKQTQEKRKC